MRPKAYLSACGIGLGHARRVEAIGNALLRMGFQVYFSSYSLGYEYLLERFGSLRVFDSPRLELLFREDGTFDFHNLMARMGFRALFRFYRQVALEYQRISSIKPDIVISDSRLSTVIAGWLAGAPVLTVLNQLKVLIPRARPMRSVTKLLKGFSEKVFYHLLDFFWRRSERLIIPDFPPPYTISRGNIEVLERHLKMLFLPGPIVPLDLLDVKPQTHWPADKPHIMVMVSGTYLERLVAYKALHTPLKRLTRSFNVSVVLGSRKLRGFSNNGLRVYNYLDNVYNLMASADILISTGGQTTLAEAMKLGIPIVVTPPRGHTEKVENAKSVIRLGVGEMIFLHEAEKKLEEVVRRVYMDDSYKSRAERLKRVLSPYRGALSVAKLVRMVMVRGRTSG